MSHAVQTHADVEARLKAGHAQIVSLGVSRLALFGSVQRGVARADSDVDLLVEFQSGRKTFDNILQLGELLERALGRSVELVTPESLSPRLRTLILEEARDVLRAA